MELAQIRYFITAAQYQNLSKAARVLNITQPALSKSISRLEDELGVLLFTRAGKKVALSGYGEHFLQNTLSSVQVLDDAVAAVKSHIPSRALNLGLFHHSDRFMRCLGDFIKSNPGISFQLENMEIASQNIDTNEFDMLLYPRIPLFGRYKGDMIYRDSYCLAINRASPLSNREYIRLSDISAHKVIIIRHSSTLFDLPYHLCVSRDIRIRDVIFTNNLETQRWLVSNNYGVGFIPESSASSYVADPEISLLPVIEDGLHLEIMVGFRREKHLSAAGGHFASFVRDYFGIA